MEAFVEKLADQNQILFDKGENNPDADKTIHIQTANNILQQVSATEFEAKTGLPGKYRQQSAKYKEAAEKRNKWAHETEYEFARLLLSDQYQDPVRNAKLETEHYTKLLLWLYDKETLQEMADVVADV